MYILYADDAGNTGTNYNDNNQPYFSLLGVLVNSDDWHTKNDIFNREKINIYNHFKDIEIHTADIFNGKTINNINFRNLGENYKNLKILEQIVDLILTLDLKLIKFAVKKQNLKNYCEKLFNSQIKIDPYLIAFTYILHFFDYYVQNKNKNGLIILDEQKSLTDNISNILKASQICTDDEVIRINRIIETSLFLESSKSNFIQIADICNFYFNRHITNAYLGKNIDSIANIHAENMYKKIEPLFIEYDPMEYPSLLSFIQNHFSIEK